MKPQQTVIVVDDDASVRDSLGMLLESAGLPHRAYASAQALLDDIGQLTHGCLLLDIRMPGMSGLELQEELTARGVALPIIFITGHGDVAMAVQAMRQGALDFVAKPFKERELLDRIHEALARERSQAQQIYDRNELLGRIDTLSRRERQVFERIAEGQSNKAAAIDLGVSERTVEVHRAQVMKKMQARTLAELVRMHLESSRPLRETSFGGS